MITVYGASDDLIEVDGDIREEFNHYGDAGDDGDALLAFSDGTLLRIRYSNEGDGLWRIFPENQGAGFINHTHCNVDDDGCYTDQVTLSGAAWVVYGSEMATAGSR